MITEEIKKTMKLRGISQIKMANMLNISKSTMSNYLAGRRSPDIETIDKIFEILHMSIKK